MANYNFTLAKQIIGSSENLKEASMGMAEDWFWTGQPVWTKEEGYTHPMEGEIGGISGSSWATPIIELEYEDGTIRRIECYTGITADKLTQIEKSMFWASGCLSRACQDYVDEIEAENLAEQN